MKKSKHSFINSFINKNIYFLSIFVCFKKFISIPAGIFTAKLMADIVTFSSTGETERVIKCGLVLILISIMLKIFNSITDIVFQKSKSRILHNCKLNLYIVFLSTPLNLLYKAKHGESIEHLHDDFNTVTNKIISAYPNIFIGILTIISYSIYLSRVNILITTILISLSLLQIIPPIIIKKYMQINYDNCRTIEGKITDFIVEGYKNFSTIKLYQLKKWWLNKLKLLHTEYKKIGNISIYTSTAQNTLNNFVSTSLKYGTCALLGLLVLYNKANIDICIQAIALSGGVFSATKSLFSTIPTLAIAKNAEERLAVWNYVSPSKFNIPIKPHIEMRNLSLSFNNNVIYKNLNTNFSFEKTLIIKGNNGVGKSSLLKLIVGMIIPTTGEVFITSVNPMFLNDDTFPHKIFILLQEEYSFNITPIELFEMVDKNRSEQMIKIAMDFNLTTQQINSTKISSLSGGEKKKVYLSIAFAINPSILLLDEPTNSLDNIGKKILITYLKQRKKGTIIVTHDPILNNLDAIFYEITKEGNIIEK